MNKFIELIPRYIRKNKKRTAFIAITIMISVIMLIFVSAVVNMLNYKYMKSSIDGIGTYHADAEVGIGDDQNPIKKRDFIETDGRFIKAGTKSYGKNSRFEIGAYEEKIHLS